MDWPGDSTSTPLKLTSTLRLVRPGEKVPLAAGLVNNETVRLLALVMRWA